MKKNDNLEIVARLLEMAKNPLSYSEFPSDYKEEHIFLANVLTDALQHVEHEFDKSFQYAVGNYKANLRDDKNYGWFSNPEELEWLNMRKNQLLYAVYGERFIRTIKFNEKLGHDAYKDFICQIDATAIMTDEELKEHYKRVNEISKEILKKIKKSGN